MKKLITLACSAALLASGAALASPEAHDFEISLGGTVKTNSFFDDNDGGITAQMGYYLTKNIQVNARQYGFINSIDNRTSVNGASGVFADFHFDLGNFQPFVGLGGLYSYGSNTTSHTFDMGAEAGVKVFVLPKTFVAAQGTYFRPVDDINNGHKAYALFSLSVGYNF